MGLEEQLRVDFCHIEKDEIISTSKKLRSTPGFKARQTGILERCEGKRLFMVSMTLFFARDMWRCLPLWSAAFDWDCCTRGTGKAENIRNQISSLGENKTQGLRFWRLEGGA